MLRWLVLAAIATATLFGRWEPTADASAQAPPPGQLTGSFPAGSGLALVVWSGGSIEQLRTASSGRGCVLESVWSSSPGRGFVGYLVGAPPPVNAAFIAIYPGGALGSQVPLVLACGVRRAAPPSPSIEAGHLLTSIRGNTFDTPLEVSVGTAVIWTNLDGVSHTVTADDLSADSPFLRTEESFEWRFASPGRFAYYCRLHQQMTGVVVIR